jgi:hypothetical protein
MSHWHDGQYSPIYAVMSSWNAGLSIDLEYVESAYYDFEALFDKAKKGLHGWSKDECEVLDGILLAMREVMEYVTNEDSAVLN